MTRPPRPTEPPIMTPVFDDNGVLIGWIDPATGEFIPNPQPLDAPADEAV